MNYSLSCISGNDEIKNIIANYNDSYNIKKIEDILKNECIKDNNYNIDVSKADKNIIFTISEGDTEIAKIVASVKNDIEKVVIKFAEHKYFKNLKYLFGSYKTELSQKEGSSEVSKDAYIKGVIGSNFYATDLTSTDKFISAEEVDLRSPYVEALNNVMFQSTRDFEGEIYGIKENGELYISGKRTKAFQRLYDGYLISALDDIVPATVENSNIVKAKPGLCEIDFDADLSLGKPKLMDVSVRKPLNDTFIVEDEPSFNYYKNLLVFEAKLNMNSPRLLTKPDYDSGEFVRVTNELSAGDSVISALALDGQGTKTHTIKTNIKKTCKFLTANANELIIIDSENKIHKSENVNYDSINYLTMSEDGDNELSLNGAQLIDMIWDSNINDWVATFGYEADEGTDFYGDKYYKFMISKSMNNILNSGESAASMYVDEFTTVNSSIVFNDKSANNKLKIANVSAFEIADNYGQILDKTETSLVSPKDIAINYYEETPYEGGEIVGDAILSNDKVLTIKEGPYLVNPDEYTNAGSKMYQKIFSDGDIDIVLQQDYIFVKNQLYTVDDEGNYTRNFTRGKHWIGAKMPITIDATMLKLRSMAVSGVDSCFNFVKNNITNFCSWALNTPTKLVNGKYTFSNLALEDSFTKDELDNYKESISMLQNEYTTSKKGLLTYAQFLEQTIKFYSDNEDKSLTIDSYAVSAVAINKVEFPTYLPLTSDLKVDKSASYTLVGTVDNGIIKRAAPYKNVIDFEEAYRLYLYTALTYVRGYKIYDSFGASLVTNIYSFGNKIYFRCYIGDVFFINKNYLHKASDIESTENWRVSMMPTASYLNGWDANDLKTIAGYNTVTLSTGSLLPVSNKERPIYFFKTTSDIYTNDGVHMFIGGYAFPAKTITEKYANMGNGKFDTTQEWWVNNLNSWIASDSKSGKTPVVLYSNDSGSTFKMLPVKQYLPESIFKDGKNRNVSYFSETVDGKIAAYVKEEDAFTTNQIVIDFDALGDVDSTATEWKQVGIPAEGEVRTLNIDEGTITYTTGRVGFGVDIDASQMSGSDTFNFDFTGNNSIVLPNDLKIIKVSGNQIKFNKPLSEDTSISGSYRILLSVSTKSDIPNQEDFLSKDSSILNDYIKSNGDLKVDSVQSVPNVITANKVYIENFPSVEDDTDKSYYEYDAYDNVKAMTNNYNNKIVLCDKNGEKFYIKTSKGQLSIDFASSLGNSINESQLVYAGKPLHHLNDFLSNATYMAKDDSLSVLLDNAELDYFNQEGLIAYMKPNVELSDFTDYLLKAEDDEGNKNPEIDNLASFVESIEDEWGFPDNLYADADSRFSVKEIGDKKYIFDEKYQVFVLNNRRYIEGTLSIPYTFYNGGNGPTIIPNPVIECNDDGSLKGSLRLANGIYYHPMGYGGLRNNTKTDNAPWIRDAAAFDNKVLTNALGDYVYLTDNKGKRQEIYNADIFTNDGLDIDYDSFSELGEHIVKTYTLSDDSSYNETNSLKFYKIEKTEIEQCHSRDTIGPGVQVEIRFYKNAKRIKDIDLIKCNVDGCDYKNGILSLSDEAKPFDKLIATFAVKYKDVTENIDVEFAYTSVNTNIITTSSEDIIYKTFGDSIYSMTFNTNSKTFNFDVSSESTLDDSFVYQGLVINDGKIMFTANATETEDRLITDANGSTLWRAPIIVTNINIYENNSILYVGDDIYESETIDANNEETVNTTIKPDITLSVDEVVYHNYKKSFNDDIFKNVIVSGVKGYSISRKPKYDTFQNLLYKEGVIIEKDKKYGKEDLKSIKIESVASDNSEVALNMPFNFTEKYNDGNEHYFRFKILTIAEQELNTKDMNNEEFYYELSSEEIEQFAPNRVWFNPNGAPVPPIKVGSKIFNSENNYAYYSKDYKNKNGVRIYICDENGHYINYDLNGEPYRLDGGDGDCSKNIYMGTDNRYVSPMPVNKTCKDWFYDNMYAPNKEINPLWQIIHIHPEIENRKWVQKIELCRYKKDGNTQTLSNDIAYPYVNINKLNQISAQDGLLKVENNVSSFNAQEGELSLLLSEGTEYFENLIEENSEGNMTLYGLNFDTKNISKLYNSEDEVSLSSTLQSSYTVNTLRDFTTKIQGDSAIAKITEMGIFDKDHKLIAYAQFPPIEYRTDRQHASFTAVIYHGNMVETSGD